MNISNVEETDTIEETLSCNWATHNTPKKESSLHN